MRKNETFAWILPLIIMQIFIFKYLCVEESITNIVILVLDWCLSTLHLTIQLRVFLLSTSMIQSIYVCQYIYGQYRVLQILFQYMWHNRWSSGVPCVCTALLSVLQLDATLLSGKNRIITEELYVSYQSFPGGQTFCESCISSKFVFVSRILYSWTSFLCVSHSLMHLISWSHWRTVIIRKSIYSISVVCTETAWWPQKWHKHGMASCMLMKMLIWLKLPPKVYTTD